MESSTEKDIEEYFDSKDTFKRCRLLTDLALKCPEGCKDFFLRAFKRERYLDMKMTALRGYANFATEQEVNVLAKKVMEILVKRPLSTPYDYQEYEPMRSPFLLPYLIDRYHYKCFEELSEQVEKQYNDMPDCYKGIFTYDEFGNNVSLRDKDDVIKSWEEFNQSKKGK